MRDNKLLVHNPLDGPEKAHRPVVAQALLASAAKLGEQSLVTIGSREWSGGEPVVEPALPEEFLDYSYEPAT